MDECWPCYTCGETTIICECMRAESCPDCGEFWKWCECERTLCPYQSEDGVCSLEDVPGHGPCVPYRPFVVLGR